MFSSTRKMTIWPLVFFGLLAAGIVIASAGVVVLAVKRSNAIGKTEAPSARSVSETYRRDLAALLSGLETSSADDPGAASRLHAAFLSMRVPGEMLEEHIAAVVTIGKMKETSDLERLIQIVGELKEKIE